MRDERIGFGVSATACSAALIGYTAFGAVLAATYGWLRLAAR
jgi:hypothetical protein